MNYKARGTRAVIAVGLFTLGMFLGADTLAQLRGGAEYRYEVAIPIIVTTLALAVVLFAWNVVEYAVKRNK